MSYNKSSSNNFRRKSGLFSSFSVTSWIIAINVIIFIVQSFFGDTFFKYGAIVPIYIVNGLQLWTLVTHMFIHANFIHLFFNMLSLFYVGRLCETIIGRKRFFWSYILCGLFAGLVSAYLAGFYGFGFLEKIFGASNIYMVGASGAIFGVVGILACLIPNRKIYLISGPLIAIILQLLLSQIFPNSIGNALSILLTIYIFFSIFVTFGNRKLIRLSLPIEMSFWAIPLVVIVPLIIIGLFVPLPIGNIAHLSGFIAGAVYGFYLRTKYKNKVLLLQRYFK